MKHLCYRLVMVFSLSLSTMIVLSQASKATLHFATGEYSLTTKQQHYLDSFASALRNIPDAYGFTIAGHTDSIGSSTYNKTLSYNRAMAVASYLKGKGFKQRNMKLEAKGFTAPVANNSNEDNKERNRRVEIEFRLQLPQVTSIAGINTPVERHEITEAGGTIFTSTGTKITVPPDAFTDASGNPVTGKVNIEYTEYRDAVDFMLSDIPMHYHNGKEAIPFNSAGMFTINATQGNNRLSLANGKRVNVGFNYDGTVRDANFYRWDAASGTWTVVQPLTKTLMDDFSDYMLARDGLSWSVCNAHNDIKQVFLVESGERYSSPRDSGIYRLYEAVKLNDLQRLAAENRNKYERKAQVMLRKYIITVYPRLLAKPDIKLDQVKGKRDRSSEMLESVFFRKRLGNHMSDSLERLMFDDYEIRQSDSGIVLVLYKGASTITLDGLEIRQVEGNRKFDARQWIAELNKQYKSYKTIASRYRDTARMLMREVDFYNSQVNRIYPLSWSSVDSINCFRMMHNEWMTDENRRLSLADWLRYYLGHKSSFASIYAGVKQTETYAAIEKKVQRFRNLRTLYEEPLAALNLSSADVQLAGNFSLSSLGTYNCDQLQRLENPVTIYAQYTDKQGRTVRPVIAMLIDSKLNGVLRYDGSYGLSPYRIAFSPRSSSRMVLIDGYGDAYLVKPSEFTSINLALNNKDTHTFVAEPIGRANNKTELKEKLSM